jgi:hypothetical protein
VGDTGPAFEFLFKKANGRDVMDLTDHAAWVSFWHPGSVPHVVRHAKVGGVTGIVTYELQGDEYDVPDDYGVLIQPTVMNRNYGSNVNGQYFHEYSYPAIRRIVKRRPS